MQLEELKRVLYETQPAAVLVAPRILRRMLQAEFKVPHLLVQAPHEKCYFFDRQVLFRHVEQDELDLQPDHLLPPTVILLARPSAEELQDLSDDALLLEYWRLLFHVQVHIALHRRQQSGKLTPEDVHDRIAAIGPTEFEEIRSVLKQEGLLLAPEDNESVYLEFVATYLELRYFRANLRPTYFPAIRDFQAIDQLVERDVGADSLFERSRPPGAPTPVICTDTSSDESHDYYWRILRHAERANAEGDTVRAAILRTKAARVAPVALTDKTRIQAVSDLANLTQRLQRALSFSDAEARAWVDVLPTLLDKADQGSWPVEAKLLFDLQNVILEHERTLYSLDVVEWVASAGKRPIKRPLTSLQLVRTTKHLRTAAQRLAMARVSDEDRQKLAGLFQSALRHGEDRLRERFWPILHDALYDAGLNATNPPEQVALQKMIEELLDRIIDKGFFSFSDLRDTLSRNQLKLPDLSDPHAYWRGDALLRLDRRLATVLEGVYRSGEFYLRWMESISSLFFGTEAGRFFTLNIALPFGGAFVLLYMLEMFVVAPYLAHGHKVPTITEEVAALMEEPTKAADSKAPDLNGDPAHPRSPPWYERVSLYPEVSFLFVGAFVVLLMRAPVLRAAFAYAGRATWRFLRLIVYDLPVKVSHLRWLRALLSSWPFLLLYWYVLKPLPICALLWFLWPELFTNPFVMFLAFILADLVLNSRFGYAISEAMTETLVLTYGWLRFDLFTGLINWIDYIFKQISSGVEYLLYTVDEWLRFRSDEGRVTMFYRGALAFFWFPIGYLIRLYFVILLEPTLNPLKLPLSSLAFKFLWLVGAYRDQFLPGPHTERLAPHVGEFMANLITFALIIPTLWLLPSAVAFFFWELKEDFRLFRANRSRLLQAVVIGKHGETMLQLLKPGFHSGAIPKLFAHLRQAERDAYLSNNWRAARTYRQELREAAQSVQQFVEREFIALIQQSASLKSVPIRVGQILLSNNRIVVDLSNADHASEPMRLSFEERSRQLLAGLDDPGWLKDLTVPERQVMTSALAGLYKLAGVDIVREQPATHLLGTIPLHPSAALDFDDRFSRLKSLAKNGKAAGQANAFDSRRLEFSRWPLSWNRWVEFWRAEQEGKAPVPLIAEDLALPAASK